MGFNGITLGRLISGEAKAVRSANAGYTRLKNIFTRSINYNTYDEFAGLAKNKVSGNLPDDILRAAANTADKKASILKIQEGFGKAADELSALDSLKLQAFEKFAITKEQFLILYKKIFSGQENAIVKYQNRFDVPHNVSSKLEKNAAKLLKNSMKDILPKGTDVNIKYLSEGTYGRGYKIEFVDKKGNKVFKDLVLKAYKDQEKAASMGADISCKLNKILEKLTDDELYAFMGGKNADMSEMFNLIRMQARNVNKADLKKVLLEIAEEEKRFHGIAAEANSAAYITKAAGHSLTQTNFNKQNMFDLKHKFSLSPYIDDTLTPVRKELSLKKLGLYESDISSNDTNTIAGRVIDFGGIQIDNPALNDKTVLKYYKKILNRNSEKEQREVIENLKKLAENPKTPLRNKIQTAIKEAELALSNVVEVKEI